MVAMVVMLSRLCFAQGSGQQIDSLLFERLRFVYPRFEAPDDTALLKDVLTKYYSLPSLLGNEVADSIGITKDSLLLEELNELLKLTTTRFFAEKAKTHFAETTLEVTPEEISVYYTENKQRFTLPGTADFFIVYAKNNLPETQKEITNVLKQRAKLDSIDPNNPNKFENEDYALTANVGYPVQPGINFYEILINAKDRKVSGPIVWTDRFVYILPMKLSKPTLKPLSEVEEMCQKELVAIKKDQLWKAIEKKASQLYPVVPPK